MKQTKQFTPVCRSKSPLWDLLHESMRN